MKEHDVVLRIVTDGDGLNIDDVLDMVLFVPYVASVELCGMNSREVSDADQTAG